MSRSGSKTKLKGKAASRKDSAAAESEVSQTSAVELSATALYGAK